MLVDDGRLRLEALFYLSEPVPGKDGPTPHWPNVGDRHNSKLPN
jgi:hypothetical protein